MQVHEHTVQIARSETKLAARLQALVHQANDHLQATQPDAALVALHQALAECPAAFPARAAILHNTVFAHVRGLQQAMDGPEMWGLAERFEALWALPIDEALTEPADLRKKLASLFHELGLNAFQRDLGPASLRCYRQALRIYQHPSFHVNLANTLTSLRAPALLADYTGTIRPHELGRHLFIACLPKCGSTYLKNLLCALTEYEDVVLFPASGQFEQEIYLPALIEHATMDTVTQQHARATEANLQLLQGFGIRPIVLVRNVFDCVVSLADFFAQGAARPTVFHPDYETLPREAQLNLIIDHLVPWYFQFVASWSHVQTEQRLEIMWVRYEDLIEDRDRELLRIARFYQLNCESSDLSSLLSALETTTKSNRFNQGIRGRGLAELTPPQIQRIQSYAQHFPSVDFQCLGIQERMAKKPDQIST